MFRHFLKITFRIFIRNKLYSLINIAGLAIGLAISMLIYLYVINENKYDQFIEKLDRIYRLEIAFSASMPTLVGHAMAANSPEIDQSVRIYYPGELVVGNIEKNFTFKNCIFADSTFFSIFSFNFISGNPETALARPLSLVLAETEAKKLFENENPVGKTVLFENTYEFTVTGVIADVKYFHIPFGGVASLITLGEERLKQYDSWEYPTYLLLPENHNTNDFEEIINNRLKKNFGYHQGRFFLRSLKDIYFEKKIEGEILTIHGDKQALFIFITIAIFILIISSINFINLSTARASIRAKEVGVKKVVGSLNYQLIRQFLFESLLISIIALFFAFIIAESFAPFLSSLTSINLSVGLFYKIDNLFLLFGFTIILGTVSGLYPAFFMNSFNPVEVLKGVKIKGKKGVIFREGLTIFQFVISIILISGTICVIKQLQYIRTKDLGFNKEHVLTLRLNKEFINGGNIFKEELLKQPNILAVSYSFLNPGTFWGGWGSMKINGKHCPHDVNYIDPDYFKTFGFQIVQGRNFSPVFGTDERASYILNETSVKRYELVDPIGKSINITGDNSKGKIIGVVKDFHYRSLHKEIEPALFAWNSNIFRIVNIRISPQNIRKSISDIEKIWKKICPAFPFEYKFLDETLDELYKKEERLSRLIGYFSTIALLIACSGIFGLSAFTAERRTKEIGIRKALGASVSTVVLMLSRDFTKWVLIANLIAWPVAYFTLNKWLQNFAYRIEISWWIFVFAGLTTFIIAVLTVSITTIRTATANPVDSLRYE